MYSSFLLFWNKVLSPRNDPGMTIVYLNLIFKPQKHTQEVHSQNTLGNEHGTQQWRFGRWIFFANSVIFKFQPFKIFQGRRNPWVFVVFFLPGISRVFFNATGSLQTWQQKNRQVLRSAASKVEESFGLSGLATGLEGAAVFFFSWVESACDFCGFDFFLSCFLEENGKKVAKKADFFRVFF